MGNSNTKKNEKEQARPSNASGNKANLINKNPEEDSQFEVIDQFAPGPQRNVHKQMPNKSYQESVIRPKRSIKSELRPLIVEDKQPQSKIPQQQVLEQEIRQQQMQQSEVKQKEKQEEKQKEKKEDIFPPSQPQQPSSPQKHKLTSEERQQMSQEKKELANIEIGKQNYPLAISLYTEAIELYDRDSLYFSNRAVARKALKQFDEALEDSTRALELDNTNIRALNLKGVVLALKSQEIKSNHLTSENLLQIQLGVSLLQEAEKILSSNHDQRKEKLRATVKSNLQKCLRILFLQSQIVEVKDSQSFKNQIMLILTRANKNSEAFSSDIDSSIKTNLVEDYRTPDYYSCVITQDLMSEPYLLQTGHTYDRPSLLRQFQSNGYIDPCTREQIDHQRIVNNKHLKNAIGDIKLKHGWLGDDQASEVDYMEIKLD